MQMQDTDAFRFALTVLAGQAVHVVAPAVAEYVPPVSFAPGHAVHSAGPVVFFDVPAAQSAHGPEPVVSLYFPATHAVQFAPV
jgi:hypothetical protein